MKNYWIRLIVFVLGFLFMCIALMGCHGGNVSWPWNKPPQMINDPIPPTPSQQLWETVKKSNSNWLVTLAIPIIALGAVAMFNGAGKLGMSAIIFGCVNLFMALATARFALWMSIFGLIGSGLAVAASILSKNRALMEIITGVQNYRKTVDTNHIDSELKAAQESPTTQRIVQNVKTKLKLKGEI